MRDVAVELDAETRLPSNLRIHKTQLPPLAASPDRRGHSHRSILIVGRSRVPAGAQDTQARDPRPARLRIGINVGGTFTDFLVMDGAGDNRIYKMPPRRRRLLAWWHS